MDFDIELLKQGYGLDRVEGPIGYLVMQNYGDRDFGLSEKLPRVMIGGVVVGNLTPADSYTHELWEGGFQLKTRKRLDKGKFVGHRIDQIITSGWTDPEAWGKELPKDNFQGVGKIVIAQRGETRDKKLRKYMVGGVITGKSLRKVGEQELWSGRVIIVPRRIHKGADFLKGMRLDQILAGPLSDVDNWKELIYDENNSTVIEHFLD